MVTKTNVVLCWVLLVLIVIVPGHARAQASTEFRDPLRGFTLYSVKISTDSLTKLRVGGGGFTSDDRMTLGFSAFFFDESDVVDDYVLWLRHDGPRRWLTGHNELPLRITLDSKISEPKPLHIVRPTDAPGSGQFIEKLEFILSSAQFEALLNAESVLLEVTTLLGLIEKQLSAAELEAIRRFNESVLARHDELISGLAATMPMIDISNSCRLAAGLGSYIGEHTL